MPRVGRELSSVAHAPSGALNSLDLSGGIEGADKKKRGRKMERGTVAWYQKWLDYFYERRKPIEKAWRAVDEKYRQNDWDGATDEDTNPLGQFGLGRVFSEVHLTEAMVFSSRPEMQVKGFTGKVTSQSAPTMQQALNNEWWTIPRLIRETRLGVRDTKKYGMGVAMTTFDLVKEPKPQKGLPPDRAAAALAGGEDAGIADEVGATTAVAAAQLPTEVEDETAEGDTRVRYNSNNTRHVPLWDFLADPDAKNPENSRIFGVRYKMDLEFIKADPFYENTDNLTPTDFSVLDSENPHNKDKHRSPYEFVEIFWLWERQPGGHWNRCVIARNHKTFLRPPQKDQSWNGHPFSICRWNEDGNSLFPQSDLMPQWGVLLAEEEVANKALDGHLREQFDLTFVPRGLLTEETFQEIIGNGEIGYYAEYDDPDNAVEDLRRKMVRPEVKPRSPETLNFLGMLERKHQIISGTGNNQLGAANKSETTATEASEIAGFARARGSYKFSAVEEFVADVAHKRLALMAHFYSKEDMIRLVGEKLGAAWPEGQFTEGDVRNGLSLIVVPGSMRPVNDEVRASFLLQLFQALGQHPATLARLDLNKWAERFGKTQGVQEGDDLIIPMSPEEQAKLIGRLEGVRGGGGGAGGSAPAVSAPASSSAGVAQQALGTAFGGAS